MELFCGRDSEFVCVFAPKQTDTFLWMEFEHSIFYGASTLESKAVLLFATGSLFCSSPEMSDCSPIIEENRKYTCKFYGTPAAPGSAVYIHVHMQLCTECDRRP